MRLKEITLEGKRFIFSPQNYSRLTNNDDPELTEPFVSVLIGPNASGKSRCLSKIADAFRRLHDKRTGKKLQGDFVLDYESEELQIRINSNDYNSDGLQLPNKVITISNSLSDKFPLKAKISDLDFYEYIGSRDSGLDKEKYSIYALVDTLQEIGHNDNYTKKTKEVFEYLGLEPKIWIKLKKTTGGNSNVFELLFNPNTTNDDLINGIVSNPRFRRLSQSHQSEVRRNLSNQDYLKGLRIFINENRASILSDSQSNTFSLSFSKPEGLSEFQRYYKFFTLLRKLNVISYETINVKKANSTQRYNLLESSSGEVNLLTTFVRTIPHLDHNALILIDEPEISLHPNWQIQYIDKLKELLDGYFNVHVIIATHSPYIVSDVNPNNCWVSKIKLEEEEVKAKLLPVTPYGWSVEDILWNVFKVPTTRNYYLSEMISDILEKLSKPEKSENDIVALKNKRDELENIKNKLKVYDPLRKVIEIVLEKI
jgi:predicted ATP-binding protein involved in virulence